MTREQAKELLPMIQAFAEGKTIQCLNRRGGWEDLASPISFDADVSAYRVKPEPREWWLVASKHLQTEPWKVFHRQPTIEDIALNNYEVIHVREVLE